MSQNIAVDLLSAIGSAKAVRSSAVKLKDLPKPVRDAIDAWLRTVNIDLDAITDPVRKVAYGAGSKTYYVVEFYTDDAEVYTGTLVFQGATLVGESSGGSS